MHRKFSSALIEKYQKLNQSDAYNSFVGQLPLLVSSLSLYYGIKSQVSSEIKTSDQHHQELLKIALEQLKTREKHQEELLKSRDQHHEELLKIIREDIKSSELRQEELLKSHDKHQEELLKSSELRQEKLLEVLTQRLDSTEKRVDYFMSGYRSVKQSEINSSN